MKRHGVSHGITCERRGARHIKWRLINQAKTDCFSIHILALHDKEDIPNTLNLHSLKQSHYLECNAFFHKRFKCVSSCTRRTCITRFSVSSRWLNLFRSVFQRHLFQEKPAAHRGRVIRKTHVQLNALFHYLRTYCMHNVAIHKRISVRANGSVMRALYTKREGFEMFNGKFLLQKRPDFSREKSGAKTKAIWEFHPGVTHSPFSNIEKTLV